MTLSKPDLAAFLSAGKGIAGERSASPWTRACRVEALGFGDEARVTCWGAGSSLSATLACDGVPGERYLAETAALLEQVEHALGDSVALARHEVAGTDVRSAGRSGVVADGFDPTYAPPEPKAPEAASVGRVKAPDALARGLRLAADLVDREDVPERMRHVLVQETEVGVVVVGTDGASCVWTCCAVDPQGFAGASAPIRPRDARALAGVVEVGGPASLHLEADHRGVRARVGGAVLEALRVEGATVTAGMLDQLIAKYGDEGRVTGCDLKALLSGVRHAALYKTKETSGTVLRVGAAEVTVIAPGGLGRTTVPARARAEGSSCYACDRIARALAGLDADDKKTSALFVPLGGSGPLQVVSDGEGWRRRHFVMPMALPEEGT